MQVACPCIGGISMLHKVIALSEHAKLHVYVSDIRMNPEPRDGLLIIPGGGYWFVSMDREGEPMALTFCGKGMNCFVLEYSVGEHALFPQPLREAALAMAHIKEHAQEYDVNPDRIFAVGFSAGGHLAGALGNFWHARELTGVDPTLAKPKGTLLVYPVISSGMFSHKGSFEHLLGTDAPTQEQLDACSLEKQVTEHTVPAFLVHTAEDQAVPVENSLLYATALSKQKIPMELHIFPRGKHGLALANEITAGNPEANVPEFAQWPTLAYDWMRRTL